MTAIRSIDLPGDAASQQRAFLADNAELLAPLVVDGDYLATVRSYWEAEPEPTDPTARDEELDGVIVRIFEHHTPTGTVIHAHGGGWVACHNDMWDQWLGQVRDTTSATVLSIEYRRPPEHPYPALIDDIATVIEAHHRNDGGAVAVLGESAGANLIAGTLIRLHHTDEAVLGHIVGAAFTYGAFDLTGRLPSHSRTTESGDLVLSREQLRWHPQVYAAHTDRTHPEISPLNAPELPTAIPALFTVGTADPLLDDTILMAHRWHSAGNPTDLATYPDSPHAFDEFPTVAAQHARAAIADWLRGRLQRPGLELREMLSGSKAISQRAHAICYRSRRTNPKSLPRPLRNARWIQRPAKASTMGTASWSPITRASNPMSVASAATASAAGDGPATGRKRCWSEMAGVRNASAPIVLNALTTVALGLAARMTSGMEAAPAGSTAPTVLVASITMMRPSRSPMAAAVAATASNGTASTTNPGWSAASARSTTSTPSASTTYWTFALD